MVGSLLFRNTLQELKRLHVGKIPWDEEIVSEELKRKWFDYVEMLLDLDKVKLNHCLKPVSATGDPSLIACSDGNSGAFCVFSYILYDLEDGSKSAALMMTKAKLGPLTDKGETAKNELCGWVLASKMKIWLIQEAGVFFKEHHHFVYSIIVKEMILKVLTDITQFLAFM